jgi:hypothetical protein
MLQASKSTLPPRNLRIMRLHDALKAARSKGPAKGSWTRGGFENIDPKRELIAALHSADEVYGDFAQEKLAEFRETIAASVENLDHVLAETIRGVPLPELWGPDDPRDIEEPYGAMNRRIQESMSKLSGEVVRRQPREARS